MQQRGERHLDRMANIVEKTVPHVEAMDASAILDRIDDVETLDKLGRRTFSLSDGDPHDNGRSIWPSLALIGKRARRSAGRIAQH